MNRCLVCRVDLGQDNPRQLCRKTYCPQDLSETEEVYDRSVRRRVKSRSPSPKKRSPGKSSPSPEGLIPMSELMGTRRSLSPKRRSVSPLRLDESEIPCILRGNCSVRRVKSPRASNRRQVQEEFETMLELLQSMDVSGSRGPGARSGARSPPIMRRSVSPKKKSPRRSSPRRSSPVNYADLNLYD